MNLLRYALNGWLAVVALDGVIRLLGGLVQATTGSRAVLMLLMPVDLLLVFGGFAVWCLLAFASQVPVRVFLPPLIATVWMNLGALPFSVIFYQGPGMQLGVGAVLLASVAASEALARTTAHGHWGLQLGPLGDDFAIRWQRLVGWVAGWITLGPVLAALYLMVGLSWSVSYSTAGFVRLTPSGIAFAHKTYQSGPDTVDLVAMVHIGEPEAYQALFEGIPDGTLALTEGVSDTDGLLTAPGDAYGRAATVIGLEVQAPIDKLGAFEARNADVDVNTFAPESIELLNVALNIYGSPDDPQGALMEYLGFWSAHQSDAQEIVDQLFADILHARNDHLLTELEEARKEADRILLPWGALHMVGISERLEDQGWEHVDTRRVTLIRWSTVLGALGG